MPMHRVIGVLRYPPCIVGSKEKSSENISNALEKLKWARLSLLFFSTCGCMGHTATVFYKRLASLISNKRGQPYSCVMA